MALITDAPPASRAADPSRDRERVLVRAAQEGDSAAFEELYRLTVRRVFAVVYRIVQDPAQAEELTQDAFVRAWQRLPSFRGESAFSSWMHPLAVNLALSALRSRKRRGGKVVAIDDMAGFDPPDVERDPGGEVDLERALARLPPGAREVFVLHDVEGYRHEDIGRMAGVATGTSKAQLHRARKLLQGFMGRR